MDDDRSEPPTVAPFVREPKLAFLFALVPAIFIALLLPQPIGVTAAVVVLIGQTITLHRVFSNVRERMARQHPGLFDDPPQGPIVS